MFDLKMGSRGLQVSKLQRALNDELGAGLTVDGDFGRLTKQAVWDFQGLNWLVQDGVAGRCTQNALYGDETYDPIVNLLRFIPQPTTTTCWAASTAMLTKTNVPAVIARTPPDLVASNGGLLNFSESTEAFDAGNRFAQSQGISMISALSSLGLGFIRSALAQGPLMFDMLWEPGKYIDGTGSPGHMLVVSRIRGDDDPSGMGTTIYVLDPWAPNVGKIAPFNYFKWINEVSTRTYRVFQ